jgi:predicted amidohydrolase
MNLPTIPLASIHLFPVKSMRGHAIDTAVVEPRGLHGDRRWMLVDANARFITARQHPALLKCSAELIRDGLVLFAPDGSVAGWQDKVQLDPGEESTYPAFATERRVFTAGPLTFGIVICHEGWRYPETVRWAVRRGAQLVFHPHADVAEPGRYRPTTFADPANSFHEKAVLCRAAENNCWFASVNAASEGSGTTSAIARPDGTLLCWQPYGQPGLLVADLDLGLATRQLAMRCRSSPL